MTRVLILCGARPSRARRIAERVSSEIPGFEICGVLQQSLRRLPRIQQLIATGDIDRIGSSARVSSKAVLGIRKILCEAVHLFLWFAHGCPRGLHANTSFTVENLDARCRQSGWPFLPVADLGGEDVVEFARRHRPDLVIALGELSPIPELLDVPSRGLARVLVQDGSEDALTVEYFAQRSERACPLVSLSIPPQPHDGLLGKTLKSDLIADDLLMQAAMMLGKGSEAEASREIKEWVQRNISPYLEQFELPAPEGASPFPRRYRSIVKLFLQSLLCLPWLAGRNWSRRMRSRYPVLILAHHLVADRPHRMGIPTEELWRRIHFLQRQYRIASLSETGTLLGAGSVRVPTVVLTFDDGYCDNYVSLRAVAEETGAKIVLFLATGQVERHQEFDHDLSAGTRGFFPLTWDQVEEWSRRGVEFGSHTRTHFDCASRERASLEPEIAGSGRDIEIRLGLPCRFFAFPFGKRQNISPEAMQIAASTYLSILSSYGGENLPDKSCRRRHLLRKNFYSHPWELELELQSVFDLVQSSKMKLVQMLARLRPGPAAIRLMRKSLWAFLYAFLVLLAILPPFRRMLD